MTAPFALAISTIALFALASRCFRFRFFLFLRFAMRHEVAISGRAVTAGLRTCRSLFDRRWSFRARTNVDVPPPIPCVNVSGEMRPRGVLLSAFFARNRVAGGACGFVRGLRVLRHVECTRPEATEVFMATRKTTRKYSEAASNKVGKAMHERKHGTLTSGRSGKKVTSRKQAIAIGLSEARREGKKVPKKKK
jgi:hypothetical protein